MGSLKSPAVAVQLSLTASACWVELALVWLKWGLLAVKHLKDLQIG